MYGRQHRVAEFLRSRLTEASQARYHLALSLLADWCSLHRVSWAVLSEEEQDWLLADYVMDLREAEAHTVQDARYCLAAAQKEFPRRTFKIAWKVLGAWQCEHPPVQAPPMPEDLAMAMVIVLTAGQHFAEALVTLVCFCGLLRVGEAMSLCKEDFVFGPGRLVLLLSRTKTGTHQRVVLENPVVVDFADRLLQQSPHCYRAAPTNYSRYRRLFLRVLRALGCEDFGFRSHSLRRGGATTLFSRDVPLQTIMLVGRWQSESSCRLYVKTGEAGLISIQRSCAQNTCIHSLAALGVKVFDLKLCS